MDLVPERTTRYPTYPTQAPSGIPATPQRQAPSLFPYGPAAGLLPYEATSLIYPSPNALTYYGGFRKQERRYEPRDIDSVLRQRPSLLSASSFNAPITRARMKFGSMNSLHGAQPSGRPPIDPFESLEAAEHAGPTLSRAMAARTAEVQEEIRAEAVRLFQEKKYRMAAGAFESAVLVDSDDFKSAIGEFFSYASMQSFNTAQVCMEQIARRSVNPFVHQMNMRLLYEDPTEEREVQTASQRFAQSRAGEPGPIAMRILVSWYLGDERDREQAVNAAVSLATRYPTSPYAAWPQLMREAMKQERGGDEPQGGS